jgi:hypothetical protein
MTQICYYIHWKRYGNNERISREEINEINSLGVDKCHDSLFKLICKYNIKWNDWIWEILASEWQFNGALDLKEYLESEPYKLVLAPFDDSKYSNWRKEVEGKGYNITRKQKQKREAIRKELEENYIMEGADIEVDGIWVKAKSIYGKGKKNIETTERVLSFRKDYDCEAMKPYRRDTYWEIMKEIVNKYKEKRINDAKIRKERNGRRKEEKIRRETSN